ncbi:hypothetical protein EELLY_v1c06650 [Entomoplasma ellychniae]|uniref:Uncharacterized protein n=2 Tax=Entomoplasmataceae TaxID=33925 RepID=A0A2S5RGM4_9MOLU|nr:MULTISPECIES: hypothetical protein [Entomoplasmataceae]PPE04979.1 hypothetical protein EELLY_v1c06650 [Entomoplasma ellychniae]PPE06489.1 hypothetical protein MCORR_v1c01170 [Mesoplasma corruscae]
MKCYIKDCEQSASASFAERVLDMNSTNNQWTTAEPIYKKFTWYFCSLHINEKLEEIQQRQK